MYIEYGAIVMYIDVHLMRLCYVRHLITRMLCSQLSESCQPVHLWPGINSCLVSSDYDNFVHTPVLLRRALTEEAVETHQPC